MYLYNFVLILIYYEQKMASLEQKLTGIYYITYMRSARVRFCNRVNSEFASVYAWVCERECVDCARNWFWLLRIATTPHHHYHHHQQQQQKKRERVKYDAIYICIYKMYAFLFVLLFVRSFVRLLVRFELFWSCEF